jgi:hypothetical protein
VLQYSFNWKQLWLIAGVSFWRLYFRFFHGAIKSPQIIEFLKALKATIRGRLLIIWDGLPAHRSRRVRELANLCAATIEEVRSYATRRIKSMQRRSKLIRTFWQKAELRI